MTVSPHGISKRVLEKANPKEAQDIYGAFSVCQASCCSLIILLDPHSYDVDMCYSYFPHKDQEVMHDLDPVLFLTSMMH